VRGECELGREERKEGKKRVLWLDDLPRREVPQEKGQGYWTGETGQIVYIFLSWIGSTKWKGKKRGVARKKAPKARETEGDYAMSVKVACEDPEGTGR